MYIYTYIYNFYIFINIYLCFMNIYKVIYIYVSLSIPALSYSLHLRMLNF